MRSDDSGEAEEPGEGGLRRAAAVEAEGELVEGGLEGLPPQAVGDAQRPPLGVGEDTVDPGQHEVGRRLADPLRVVLDLLEVGVAGPAVTDDRAAVGDVAGDEAARALGRVVPDHRQPDAPRAGAPDLDRAGDQQLAVARPPGPGRRVPGAERQAGLVDLHQAAQRRAVGVDHRRPQLAQRQPGRLVAARAELEPQLPGRHPVPVRRHQPGGGEPDLQRQVAAVHHRARRHRGLAPAGPALQGQDLAPEPPEAVVAAPRAGEAPAPAVLQQPLGAGRLVREPALELRQRPGKIRHGAIPPIPLQDWIAWWVQRDKPFPRFPDIELVRMADIDHDAAIAGAKRWGWAEASDDPASVTRGGDIDVVIVITPNDSHATYGIDALAHGKHLVCEKPLANTVADALRLAEAARKSDRVSMVNFVYRAWPGVELARELIAAGELGELVHFQGHFFQDYAADPALGYSWRFDKAVAGGGAFADIGSHIMDIACTLMGPVRSISARSKRLHET